METKRRLVIIPVYEEHGKISKLLSRFEEHFAHEIFLVADAPSESFLDEIRNTRENVKVPVRLKMFQDRGGVGRAIKAGIDYARENRFDIIVVMAGNGKDNPVEIPRLLRPILQDEANYVQGSRFMPGGVAQRNPILRGIFSRLFPLLWTLCTRKKCTDVTNGFRAYCTSIFDDKRINIWQDWLDRYGFEYYLHYKVLKLGYRFREVPVSKTYAFRHKGGYSKISPFLDWWDIVSPLILLSLGARK